MNYEKIMGIVRALLAGAGGVAVGLGVSDAETMGQVATSVETIGGAILVIVTAVASVFAKLRA